LTRNKVIYYITVLITAVKSLKVQSTGHNMMNFFHGKFKVCWTVSCGLYY